jgi:hypothetical protein
MTASVHRLLKFIVGSFAALQGGAAAAAPELPRPHIASQDGALTMPAFITRLRQDAALRARFARDPRGVLRGHGIDPSPFKLADRLDETELERLLAVWTAGAPARVKLAQATPRPPAGPAPLLPPNIDRPVPKSEPPVSKDELPAVPAVVYGPPPGPPSVPRPPAPPDAGPPPAPNADRPVQPGPPPASRQRP